MRSLALLLVALPLAAQAPAITPFQQAKARALLRTQLSCLGCHELGGEGGRVGPSLTTVAERRNAAYIRAIIDDPQRIVPGAAMPKTPMPAATRELLIRYFSRGQSERSERVPPQADAAVSRVEHTADSSRAARARNDRTLSTPPSSVLYQRWCAACHGESGGGDGPNARYLPVRPAIHNSAAQMSARSDDALFDAIAGGGAIIGKSPRMPAFGATLASAEVRSLVRYIRTLCACEGPVWSRDNAKQ